MKSVAFALGAAALAWGFVSSVTAAQPSGLAAGLPAFHGESDHALLDGSAGDTSVQCGAFRDRSKPGTIDGHDTPAAFIVFITIANRADQGGFDGGVRVGYEDGDFVDYPIAAGQTLQMTLAAGGTLGVDSLITVSESPADSPLGDGAVLIGQVSIYLGSKQGHPHPDIAPDFCITTP